MSKELDITGGVEFWTTGQVLNYCNFGKTRLYQLIANGKFRVRRKKVKGVNYYLAADVRAFASNRQGDIGLSLTGEATSGIIAANKNNDAPLINSSTPNRWLDCNDD